MNINDFILEQSMELEDYIENFISDLQIEIKSQFKNSIKCFSIFPENMELYQDLNNKLKDQVSSYIYELREIPKLVTEFNCKLLNYISCISAIRTMNIKKEKLIEAIIILKDERENVKIELEKCKEQISKYTVEYDISYLQENEKLASIFHNENVSYLDFISSDYFADDDMSAMLKKELYEFINTQPSVFEKLQHKEYYISKLNIKKSFLYYKRFKINNMSSKLYNLKNSLYCERQELVDKKREVYYELTDMIYNNDSYLFKKMLYGIVKDKDGKIYSRDVKNWLKSLDKKEV